MIDTNPDSAPQQRADGRQRWCYVAAAALAVPVGGVAWFELTYLWFGLTGEDPTPVISMAAGISAFCLAFGWPLRAHRAAEVVIRSCTLGQAFAVLLPVVALAVLLVWQSATGRRDLGMGGLMLYSFPIVAFVACIVLVIVFGIGKSLAAKRLQRSANQRTL